MMPARSVIEVVLADDHDLVRAGFRSLLEDVKDMRVIAEVRDGAELLQLLESVHPDVVVTDLSMPGVDGVTALRRIRQRWPELRVIVVSMSEDPESVRRAVASGANGYLRKDAPDFELEMAVRSVVSTGRYFGERVAAMLAQPAPPAVHDLLTQRQIEILQLLASGRSSKEIAFDLGLSSKTVDVHRTRIMERLGLKDLASLTLYAVREGLVKP